MARLLLIEDDVTIGRALHAALAAHSYTVHWVQTGAEAVRTASEGIFDLALIDLGLPDIDGIEVCRQVRSAQPNCVLVILTARDEEIEVVVGLEAGAEGTDGAGACGPLRARPGPRPELVVAR